LLVKTPGILKLDSTAEVSRICSTHGNNLEN
jgi:hypothetical protein